MPLLLFLHQLVIIMTFLLVLVLTVFTYFFGICFGWFVHKLLHRPIMGRLNESHMAHHLRLYPPGDFFDFEYRDAGKDNSTYLFAPFVVLFVISVIGTMVWLGVPWLYPIVFIVETAVISYLHHYIHYATHITDHWLGYFKIFREWQRLHILHHHFMDTNYGIISFLWDKAFGTYLEEVEIDNP